MKKSLFVAMTLVLMGVCSLFALEAVEVADLTLKIPDFGTQVLYYRFAAGDTILVNAEPLRGRNISGITIKEWPTSVRFQDTKTRWVDKKISVPETAVYSFELANNGLLYRTYQISIKRIPSNEELIGFNTNVVIDTFYDTIPEEIVNTTKKIGSQLTGGMVSRIQVSLPQGTAYWVYWIGVGQEAAEGLQGMVDLLPEVAKMLGIVNPVIGYALGYLPKLYTLNQGLDINYSFEKYSYGNWTTFKFGSGIITDYAKMDKPVSGNFYIELDNSYSVMTSKEVTVKVVAVRIISKYEIRTAQ